jgi:Mor family transcriptional regulator
MTGILPEQTGVLSMKTIAEISRHQLNGDSIRSLAREYRHSRNTIRKYLQSVEEPVYRKRSRSTPSF